VGTVIVGMTGKVIAGKTKRTLINVTSRTHFDELLKSYPNVIVDFTAKRCGPCQQLKPILKRLNSEIDEIQIIMVDVDKHEPISDEFGIMQMPTLLAMKNGKKRGKLEEQSFTYLKKEIKAKFRI
jgi:thioredoxin 1